MCLNDELFHGGDFRLPFSDTTFLQQEQETSFTSLNQEEECGFVEPLNRIVNVAISKVHVHTFIRQIQIVLNDSEKSEQEKFVETCQLIDKALKNKTLKDPLCSTFCQLFNKEVLDFFCQEIKKVFKQNKNELLTRLENLYKRLAGQMIKPSPLRDLLIDLKEMTRRYTEKTHWSVPTGIKQLNDLLSSLDWTEDEALPKILRDCTKIIARRLKCSYLTRDPFTFFLYRNFHPILSSVSRVSFEAINGKISCASASAIGKCRQVTQALTHLYLWFLALKSDINAAYLDNKGKTLGIFANKPPDGIYRLRMCLNKLSTHFSVDDESEILLIKIFMQIKEILLEKAVFSKMRSFRAPEISAFYQCRHSQIENIYNELSESDKEVFCAVNNIEADCKETKIRLAIPKGYAILSNPEKMSDALEKMRKLYSQQLDFRQGVSMSNRSVYRIHEDCELSSNTAENSSAKRIFESAANETVLPAQPSCSYL